MRIMDIALVVALSAAGAGLGTAAIAEPGMDQCMDEVCYPVDQNPKTGQFYCACSDAYVDSFKECECYNPWDGGGE